MRLLLDTHAFAWWVADDTLLGQGARHALADPANEVLVSAVVAWEIATKHRIGKWPDAAALLDDFEQGVRADKFISLPITAAHAIAAARMAWAHKDPFDRLLLAQTRIEDAWLVSRDAQFASAGAPLLWA